MFRDTLMRMNLLILMSQLYRPISYPLEVRKLFVLGSGLGVYVRT